MKKIELKHLVPYLPYELKVKIGETLHSLDGIYNELVNDSYTVHTSTYIDNENYEYEIKNNEFFKPILRPLSDLNKIIEFNGYSFIPLVELNTKALGLHKYRLFIDKEGKTRLLCDYHKGFDVSTGEQAKETLISWHFDVFGLINKGLAIDINTLKE